MTRATERAGQVNADTGNDTEPSRTVQLDAPLRQLLAKGRPSVQEVVDVMREHPMQRIAMMETLQRELGNTFAQQVTAQMRPSAGGPLAHGPLPANGLASPAASLNVTKGGDAAATISNAKMFEAVADKQLATINGALPGYVKARNALDKEGVHYVGMAVLSSLELLRAALRGMGEQVGKQVGPQQCAPGSDPIAELEYAQQLTEIQALRERLTILAVHSYDAQKKALHMMTPREFRGSPLAEIPEPDVGVDNHGNTDVRRQVGDELVRTVTVINATDRLFTQFAKPGALKDSSKRWMARQEIEAFSHRPADLVFMRAALMSAGLWQELNTEDAPGGLAGVHRPKDEPFLGIGVCKDEGPLTSLFAETKERANEMGWLTDTGTYDRGTLDMLIQLGDGDSVGFAYQHIMSATPDGRAQILYSLQRRNRLEPFLKKLPWKYTKDIHDGLPGGHGDIKSALQAHFLVEGKWGTNLGVQEYHAPSLTKIIRDAGDSVGGIGEDIIDGLDTALNVVTLGFHHSYGEARDLHSQGLMTDDDYATALRQITTRTTVGMAIMMATAGFGRAAALGSGGGSPAMMGAMGLNRGVAGTTLAAGVEGATFATAEMFALDTTDIATGAKGQYSDTTDYLKAMMMGGGMGAMVGGTTSFLSSRAAARYLPSNMLTKGQSLASQHPSLAPVLDQLQGVGRGTTIEVRITATQADDLAHAGVIDAASHKALKDALVNNAEVRAVIEVVDDLDMPMSATATGGSGGAGGGPKVPAPSPSLSVKNVGPSTTAGTTTATTVPQTLKGGLPKGAVVVKEGGAGGDSWVVYEHNGAQRIRFRTAHAKTLQEANQGRNYSKEAKAGVNDKGEAFVLEGRHRAIGNATNGDEITPDKGGVVGQKDVLDYEYTPMRIEEEGVFVRDLKIDYSEPDVSAAEADFMRAKKFNKP